MKMSSKCIVWYFIWELEGLNNDNTCEDQEMNYVGSKQIQKYENYIAIYESPCHRRGA